MNKGNMDFEKKRNRLKDTAFKLVSKYPYSVIRTKLDRIGRQIQELDDKLIRPGRGGTE